jgi:3-methylfumaryl-CoA hydratase
VTDVEGYPDLIVHGPLIATLLVELVRRQAPSAFDFKTVRPTFDMHPFRLNAQPSEDDKTVRVRAQNHQGWLTMQGTVGLA